MDDADRVINERTTGHHLALREVAFYGLDLRARVSVWPFFSDGIKYL